MDKNDAIIEFYGPVIRIGVVGKWVWFMKRPKQRPTRKELLMLIEQIDSQETVRDLHRIMH